MIEECVDFLVIEAWLDELEDSRRRRILKNRPDIDNAKLKRMVDAEDIDAGKYRMIMVGGTIEFAVEKSTGVIYPVVKDEVKRKTNYGRLMDWEFMDWEPYYPFRKSLYDWQDEEAWKSGLGESQIKHVSEMRTTGFGLTATVETKQGSKERNRRTEA